MSVQRIEYKTKLLRWTTEGIKRPSEQKHSVRPLWPFTFGQINTDFVFTVFELWPPQSSLFILTSVCANCERIPRSCLYSCYLHRKEDGWTGRKDGRFSKRPRTLEDITVLTATTAMDRGTRRPVVWVLKTIIISMELYSVAQQFRWLLAQCFPKAWRGTGIPASWVQRGSCNVRNPLEEEWEYFSLAAGLCHPWPSLEFTETTVSHREMRTCVCGNESLTKTSEMNKKDDPAEDTKPK